MKNEQQHEPFNHFVTADLNPELVERLQSLESDLRNATNKDVVLIAYEETE